MGAIKKMIEDMKTHGIKTHAKRQAEFKRRACAKDPVTPCGRQVILLTRKLKRLKTLNESLIGQNTKLKEKLRQRRASKSG